MVLRKPGNQLWSETAWINNNTSKDFSGREGQAEKGAHDPTDI